MKDIVFLILLQSKNDEQLAGIVIESLRTFGGVLSDAPIWVFVTEPDRVLKVLPHMDGIERFPIRIDADFPSYPFAVKVYACSKAEALAGMEIRSLVWLSLDCLIINPPLLFNLDETAEVPKAYAAFRPVHHRNIGSLASEQVDSYWGTIYQTLGVDQMPHKIISYADGQTLRPYFNSHCFSFKPALGLGQAWWHSFQTLVKDQHFQSTSCCGNLNKTFLHQAVLSTLVAKIFPWDRVRILPPEYNFPLNLLDEISDDKKPKTLNQLVNVVYEDTFPWGKIRIEEPLLSWLRNHL